ncbi:DUF1206 domain-containing protein [Chroococcidiopsis sp. SAG 2025]|uniref:DUF1206 domain-containing protein n=1 Tax=Chroococcidiopsis sp. SAG 2025 TaxID=171389 RepID=UPI0029371906|nr:DUF1206 domain-containing protein [Chroococcidiopsis sp. SAG 2025]
MQKLNTDNSWIEQIARFGYAIKGVVYLIVGLLAMPVALGIGDEAAGTNDALQLIMRQPLGKFLLIVVAVGLVSYAVWRFIQAFVDPEHQGSQAKRVVPRLGYAISGTSYAGLAVTAIQIIAGTGSHSSSWRQDWAARLLAQPFGQWLLGIVGVVVLGIGVSFAYVAFTPKFRQRLQLTKMSTAGVKWAIGIGRFGVTARGVAFGVIGLLLIQAAVQSDPDEATGLGGALQTLAEEPFGRMLLGIIAIGLVAYAIHLLILARYRRIRI